MKRSGRNFAHVTTAELLWHVQIGDLMSSLEFKLERNKFTWCESWLDKCFVKCVPIPLYYVYTTTYIDTGTPIDDTVRGYHIPTIHAHRLHNHLA